MEGRLEREVIQKTNELRVKLKNLANTYGSVFQISQRNHNNKLIFLKRNLDKLKTAQMRISSISLNEDKQETFKNADENKEISKLCSETLQNIAKIENLIDRKVVEEKVSSNYYSKKMSNLRKNLDNLKLAYNSIRRIDPSMNLTNKEWNSIEKDI